MANKTNQQSKYKVGEKIKDGSGVDWVIARIWEQKDAWDYEIINTVTGEYGSLRELMKTNQVCRR